MSLQLEWHALFSGPITAASGHSSRSLAFSVCPVLSLPASSRCPQRGRPTKCQEKLQAGRDRGWPGASLCCCLLTPNQGGHIRSPVPATGCGGAPSAAFIVRRYFLLSHLCLSSCILSCLFGGRSTRVGRDSLFSPSPGDPGLLLQPAPVLTGAKLGYGVSSRRQLPLPAPGWAFTTTFKYISEA